MIDFLASATIALIVIMTLVIFLSNQRQASILKQMRAIMDSWYQAQMRDRRETFKDRIEIPDVLKWVGEQVDLDVIEQRRKLSNPPAVEFMTSEGSRLVVSPLPGRKLQSGLKAAEGKRRRVANLVEPLLGYRPSKVQVMERSNSTVHEWYEVEIETAVQQLNLNWINVTALYFYLIPRQSEKQKMPRVSIDLKILKTMAATIFSKITGWFKQSAQRLSTEPAAPKKTGDVKKVKKPVVRKRKEGSK